jgi:hypothetical protein
MMIKPIPPPNAAEAGPEGADQKGCLLAAQSQDTAQ